MTNKDIIRKLILREVEAMAPSVQSFDEDPINFLLQKYPTLKKTLEMLMTPAESVQIVKKDCSNIA